MKRIVSILSALLLLTFSVAALGETDLNQLVAANNIGAAKDTYPALAQHATIYDPETGEAVDIFTGGLVVDPAAGPTYYFIYQNGDVMMYDRDGGAIHYGDDGSVYAIGFVGSASEEMAEYVDAENWGEFFDGQMITAEETTAEGKLLITTEGVIPADYSPFGEMYAGQKMVARHIVNPDNLIMEASESFLIGSDGVEKPLRTTVMEQNPAFDLPFDVQWLKNPEEAREIRVILNPGADDESVCVLTAPLNVEILIYTPAGYALYDDQACTIPMTSVSPDENGKYPKSMTVYCAALAG